MFGQKKRKKKKKERKEKRVEAGQGGRADNDKGAEKDAVHQVV